ncbi:hypothetical protein ALC60_14243 [Trachymyrmex zeteki]|uniref:Uncharacterized protein n=1 Tax=Mycetomoellerius zeteki TaxID=64791 RepID=A0A151WFV9_9HYME|nr:hypothetical protein ALC60_14243 [Trachymyrmex zeteki]
MHAHAREGELAGSAAADSLRGENSKSFAVTIFLTASPAPSTIVKKRGREREKERSSERSRECEGENDCLSFINDVSNNDFNHHRTDNLYDRDSRLPCDVSRVE